jgi:hypothetical protein
VNTIRKHEVEKISPTSLIKESSMEIKFVMTIESISQVEFIRWYVILTCPPIVERKSEVTHSQKIIRTT